MLRLPQEPDDTYKPFGEKVVKTTTAAQPAAPYTVYTPIKGKPGWEDDGYGHQRYDATADAAKHERAEEKRLAKLRHPEVALLYTSLRDNPEAKAYLDECLQFMMTVPDTSSPVVITGDVNITVTLTVNGALFDHLDGYGTSSTVCRC